MNTLSANIPSALIASIKAARIAKARTPKVRKIREVSVSTMTPGTGHTLDELLQNVRGGFVGVQKLVRHSAYRSCRRAFAQYDVQPASDMVVQIVDDTTEEAMSAVLDRFGSQYDPSKGAVSTWISHTVWFVISNHIRDKVIPTMMAVRMTDQADRDGASHQQGMDRYLIDHCGKCHTDRDTLSDSEQLATAHEIVADLPDELRTVLLSSLDPTDSDKSLTERSGLSAVKISQIRGELREMGIESKRSRLHK